MAAGDRLIDDDGTFLVGSTGTALVKDGDDECPECCIPYINCDVCTKQFPEYYRYDLTAFTTSCIDDPNDADDSFTWTSGLTEGTGSCTGLKPVDVLGSSSSGSIPEEWCGWSSNDTGRGGCQMYATMHHWSDAACSVPRTGTWYAWFHTYIRAYIRSSDSTKRLSAIMEGKDPLHDQRFIAFYADISLDCDDLDAILTIANQGILNSQADLTWGNGTWALGTNGIVANDIGNLILTPTGI